MNYQQRRVLISVTSVVDKFLSERLTIEEFQSDLESFSGVIEVENIYQAVGRLTNDLDEARFTMDCEEAKNCCKLKAGELRSIIDSVLA